MTTYNYNELLVKLTEKTIKDVVEHYRDRINDGNMKKIIERGIAKRLVMFVPDEWTQIDVQVYEMAYDLNTFVNFTNDKGDTLTAVHNEIDVLEFNKDPEYKDNIEWWDIQWKPTTGANGEVFGIPDWQVQNATPHHDLIHKPIQLGLSSSGCGSTPKERLDAFKERIGYDETSYDPISLTEDYVFGMPKVQNMAKDTTSKPLQVGVSGCGVAPLDDPIRFGEISWLDIAAVIPDSKGTCGWSEEVTNRPLRRGSLVETLPGAQGQGLTATEVNDLRNKVIGGFDVPKHILAGYTDESLALEHTIEFTLDDLDELKELINKVESQVMEF